MNISLYNGVKDNKGSTITVTEALDIIAGDSLSNQIYAITHEFDEAKRAKLKAKLPAVTWSGTFSRRAAANLLEYSGLICMDFDKLSDTSLTHFRKALAADPYTFACFLSPSMKGVKVLVKVSSPAGEHTEAWQQLADYYNDRYGYEADVTGKDVSRLCFLSWHNGLYRNPESKVFEVKAVETKPKPKSESKVKAVEPQPFFDAFTWLRQFTDKKFTYAEGSRNRYINGFVMNCKAHGIGADEAAAYCVDAFSDYVADEPANAVPNIVKSVYDNPKIQFAQYSIPRPGAGKALRPQAKKVQPKATAPAGVAESGYNEAVKFWYEVEKVDEKTGEIKVEVKFDHDRYTFFLANNGFRKICLGTNGYQFVRLVNGLLESVEPNDISNFVSNYLKKDVEPNSDGIYDEDSLADELAPVRSMYKRGSKTYTQPGLYAHLPEIKPQFLRDTEKVCYMYFEKSYAEITGDKVTMHPYSDLQANIWSKQRIPFDVKLIDNSEIEKAVISQFISLAIVGEGNDDDKDKQRIQSMCSTIGYCIDTYKDPTVTKAPVFQDKKINYQATEANGGTGKSLTAKMIAKLINTCMIDGKDFRFDKPYPYDTFRLDHKLIVYNDVNRKFPFEQLFHKITEDFQFDRRYVDAIVIKHEDAPKHLIISNYSLSGDGPSFNRRQQIIEFSDYFNDEHTPFKQFGHRFFYDWDSAEWNRFYNFFILCVQLYKKRGLIPFPAQNVKMNKLLNEAGEEFIDWMDELFIGSKEQAAIRTGVKEPKDELFEALKTQIRRYSQMQNSNKFTGWAKQWADMRGYIMHVDKSGAKRYWTFTQKENKQ